MSGTIKRMYLDKEANVWELIQRYHTDNYTYSVIRNVLTTEQRTETDWTLQRRYFAV